MRWLALSAVLFTLSSCRGEAVDSPLAEDAATDAVSDTADTGTSSNLLKDGTFELGCANWESYYSILHEEGVARSASKACRPCRATANYFYVAQSLVGARKKGERFLAKAWVRSAEGMAAPTTVGFVIEGTDTRDVVVDYVKGSAQPVTSTWTEVQAVLELKTDATVEIHVRVGAEYAAGDQCFIVDDASMVKLD